MGLLRTLLIILIIYYGLKLVARFVFPLVMKRFANNVEKRFNEQQDQFRRDQQQTNVGETVIDKAPREQKSNESIGEYVDFEEVD
ncbi:MAG: DUF4834 family protein [Flavobacteriaceae bacterium]|nr:DUF4834 family protein [Flavobacteriaceae bacterium]